MDMWVLTDDYRCPMCMGPVEMKNEELEDDDGVWTETKLRCLECGHQWTAEA